MLQRIARGAFGVIPAECASEIAFAELFRNWYNALPVLTQQHPFADSAVRGLLTNTTSSAPTARMYLDIIPRQWYDNKTLQVALADNWEDWSVTVEKAVADEYERCVQVVNEWQPPVAEADFFGQLGAAFDLPATGTADQLLAQLQAGWLPTLPERTRTAPWQGQSGDEALLMKHLLHGGDAHRLFSQTLPERWHLRPLATMDTEAVVAFVAKTSALRQAIAGYRRPLLELVQKLKRSKTDHYESVKDYQNSLTNALRDTAAYKHNAETDPTLPEAPARLLLAQLRNRVGFERLVAAFAAAIGLPAEQHFWTKEEESQFVAAWKKVQETLFNWQFPEDLNLDNARQKLRAEVQAVQAEFGLTAGQLGKILDDLKP